MVRVAEVALLGRSQPRDRGAGVLAEDVSKFGEGPHVEASLDSLRVGVQRAVEAALGAAHLAQRPLERVDAYLQQALVVRSLPAVQIRAREQGVVVEHLLEVRHRPSGVDAVA